MNLTIAQLFVVKLNIVKYYRLNINLYYSYKG